MIKKRNIADITGFENNQNEVFETIASGSAHIERIISHGQITPEGVWYDQPKDEWVLLLQGEAMIEFDDQSAISLSQGDCLLIAAHSKHRVAYTSIQPPCIWIAVHGNLT